MGWLAGAGLGQQGAGAARAGNRLGGIERQDLYSQHASPRRSTVVIDQNMRVRELAIQSDNKWRGRVNPIPSNMHSAVARQAQHESSSSDQQREARLGLAWAVAERMAIPVSLALWP